MSPDALLRHVQDALSPDLLRPEYREGNRQNRFHGHCYVAAEALFHLLRQHGHTGWVAVHARDDSDTVHWWLERGAAILDPTEAQYETPPYATGRRAGFLTREPSKRARVVIRRVNDAIRN